MATSKQLNKVKSQLHAAEPNIDSTAVHAGIASRIGDFIDCVVKLE
jgi:hypothetical protein